MVQPLIRLVHGRCSLAGGISFYNSHVFRQISGDNQYLTLMSKIGSELKVGIHQPSYLPWLGYFYKMAISDVFIFLDDAEFPKGSYVNRNKIAVNGDAKWLTVPTGRSYQAAILDAFPSGEKWVDKHIRLLESAYKAAPYFSKYFDRIVCVLRASASKNFAGLNMALIEYVASRIGVNWICLRSSQMGIVGRGDARLAELVGGSVYVSGSGDNYKSESAFSGKNIDFECTDFTPEAYPQVASGFISGLGCLMLYLMLANIIYFRCLKL